MQKSRAADRIRKFGIAGFALVLLGGCLMEEDSAKSGDSVMTQNRLSGSVGDGPVVGASMQVTRNDGEELQQFESTSNASYNITVNTELQYYPLTIESVGGTDLVTNLPPDYDMRGAAMYPDGQNVVNVNPFSTIADYLSMSLPGGRNVENLEQAQSIVSQSLNSGLDSLVATGPMTTHIDEHNIAEIVRASETLGESIRRTTSLLLGAGFSASAESVVLQIASDLTDGVVDGRGGSDTNARTAAVFTLTYAQVLLESLANQLRVNGSDATNAMNQAISQVSVRTPTRTIEELPATAQMINKARVGLAAAYAVGSDDTIMTLHADVSGLQSGMDAMLVRNLLPSDYQTRLPSVLVSVASASTPVIDMINGIARGDGDIDPANEPPVISGTPPTSVTSGTNYSFTPGASDPDGGDTLTFSISGRPSWASFNSTNGQLSGTPGDGDIGSYPGITISVSDGSESDTLGPFAIEVRPANTPNAPPSISGTPSAQVNANNAYDFTPSASDPDAGDTLTFSISNRPSWASFDSASGRLSGTPGDGDVGVYSNITISVSDGSESASLSPFSITVQAISLGSVTLNWTAPTENEDGSTLTDLAGYKIFWGTTPGSYTNSVTLNNPGLTTYVVENLAPGTYEFVAKSFNASGVESVYSSPATRTVP